MPHTLTLDGSGNLILAGYFSGTADFDMGAGVANRTSTGGRDCFVAKYTSAGTLLWVTTFGSAGDDDLNQTVVAGGGAVYVTGFFTNSMTVGSSTLTSAGGEDGFVAKLDASGNHVWAYALGGAGNDSGNGIGVDGSEQVWVTGDFTGTMDLDPGAGTSNVTSAGGADLFAIQLNSSGAFQRGFRLGSGGTETANVGAAWVKSDGTLVLSGYFTGTVDFDPGIGMQTVTSRGNADAFVAVYSSTGAYQRAWGLGGLLQDGGHRVACDASGNFYVSGWARESADFGGGTVTLNGTAQASDAYVAKYSPSGTLAWAVNLGGAVSGSANLGIVAGMALHADGRVAITGKYYGNAAVGSGSNTVTLTNHGGSDVFLATFDANGVAR